MSALSSGQGRNISILLADSFQIRSQLLSSALRRQPGFRVTSDAADLSACLDRIQSCYPDVILLGGMTPDDENLQSEVLSCLHSTYPEIPIVLLVNKYDRQLVVSALRAGAHGLFCLVSQPFKALCRCIHAVCNGQFWLNTEQFSYVIEALATGPSFHIVDASGQTLLTSREEQVVSLVAEGMGNREVARKLKLSENSVKKALLRIFDKLGISNRVELVLYVLTQRSLDTQSAATLLAPALPGKPVQNTKTYKTKSIDVNGCEVPSAAHTG